MNNLITLSDAGRILSNIGNRLTQNKNILKILKYNTSDCLTQPDLTLPEILEIIGRGSNPKMQRRIFNVPFNDKIIEEGRSELRFFISQFRPENIYLSSVNISFQIVIHTTIWEINEGYRPMQLIHEILNDFNGYDIGSIGELQLNGGITLYNWSSDYDGFIVNMKTRTK